MKIEVDVFDDGKDPVTCIRNDGITQKCEMFIGTSIRGKCRIFSEGLWPQDADLSRLKDNGSILPHDRCIEARVKAIQLTRNQHTLLWVLHDEGGAIGKDGVAGYEVQAYNQLVKKGVVKHLLENSGYQTTFLGREYVRIQCKND